MTELHFAFPDGSLDYDCPNCTQSCCKGLGFGGRARDELWPRLSESPELAVLLSERRNELALFANPPDGCFFLDEQGLCRIQKDHGLSAKPLVCRLVPFERMNRLGNTVLVAPNWRCELRLVLPPKPGRVKGDHAALAREIRESGMLETGLLRVQPEGSETEDAFLTREKAFLALCGEGLERGRFCDTLCHHDNEGGELREFLRELNETLSLAACPADAAPCDRLFHAWGPAASLSLISHPPRMRLRILAAIHALISPALSALRRPASLRDLDHLARHVLPLAHFLAATPTTPSYRKPGETLTLPGFERPELTLAAAIYRRERDKGHSGLAALKAALPDALSPLDRFLVLHRLATLEEE